MNSVSLLLENMIAHNYEKEPAEVILYLYRNFLINHHLFIDIDKFFLYVLLSFFFFIYIFFAYFFSSISIVFFEYSIYFSFLFMDSKNKKEEEIDLASILGEDMTQMDEARLEYFSKVPIDVPVLKPIQEKQKVLIPARKKKQSLGHQLGFYVNREDYLRHEFLRLKEQEFRIAQQEMRDYYEYVSKINAIKKAEEEEIRLFRESVQRRLKEDPWFARTKYIHPNYYLDFDIETPLYDFIIFEFNTILNCYLRTGEGIFSNINLIKDEFNLNGLLLIDLFKNELFMDFWSCFFGTIIFTVCIVESFWYSQEIFYIFLVDTYWLLFIKFASEKQKAKNSYKVKKYSYKFKRKEINEKFKEFRSDLMKTHYEVISHIQYKIEQDPEEAEIILEQLTNSLDITRHHTMDLIALSHELDRENNINRKLTIEERRKTLESFGLDDVLEDERDEASKTLLRFKGMKEYQMALALTIEKRRKTFMKRINEDQFNFLNPDFYFFSENSLKNFLIELDEEDLDYIVNIMKNQFLMEFNNLYDKEENEDKYYYTNNDKKNIKDYLDLSLEELLKNKKNIEELYKEKLNELNELYMLKEKIDIIYIKNNKK